MLDNENYIKDKIYMINVTTNLGLSANQLINLDICDILIEGEIMYVNYRDNKVKFELSSGVEYCDIVIFDNEIYKMVIPKNNITDLKKMS